MQWQVKTMNDFLEALIIPKKYRNLKNVYRNLISNLYIKISMKISQLNWNLGRIFSYQLYNIFKH